MIEKYRLVVGNKGTVNNSTPSLEKTNRLQLEYEKERIEIYFQAEINSFHHFK